MKIFIKTAGGVSRKLSDLRFACAAASVILALGVMFCAESRAFAVEDWKGPSETSELSFGGLLGVGLIDNSSGLAVLGTASKKVIKRGFVPDINNSVSVEGYFGPVALTGVTAWAYSFHLRWDFDKDPNWTLYAVGGVGGNWLSTSNASGTISNSRFEFFPRFGVGAFWKMTALIHWRGEIAHDLIAVGVNFPL